MPLDECGAVIGVIHRAILRDLISLIPEQNPAPPELLRSHHELRAALIMVGRHIRKLSFGRQDDLRLIRYCREERV